MTTAPAGSGLEALLAPISVAVLGASDDPASIRGKLLKNLRVSGYGGRILPINRRLDVVQGVQAFRDVREVGEPIDLVLAALPADVLVSALEDSVDAGAKAAVVFSGIPVGEQGQEIESQIAELAVRHSFRVLGPNALGVIRPADAFAATFAPLSPAQFGRPSGGGARVGIVSQSGGTALAWLERCQAAGMDVVEVVMLGNEADVTAVDVLRHDLDAEAVDLLLLFIEGVDDGGEFREFLGRAADLDVPVIALKVGRTGSGAQAAMSHTGHLAGVDAAYQALFERYGVVRVSDTDEMVTVATAMARRRYSTGSRVAMVTAGGGTGGMAADLAGDYGLELDELSPGGQRALQDVVPAFGSARNPVDVASIVEDAGERFCRAIEVCDGLPEVSGIIAAAHFGVPEMVPRMENSARQLMASTTKPIFFHSTGIPTEENSALLREIGLDLYSLRGALEALRAVSRYGDFQRTWRSTSRERSPVTATVAESVDLSSVVAQFELLAQYGIPLVPWRVVQDADEAVAAAQALGFPVVVKILSADIHHKSDVGGVVLHLSDEAAVREAVVGMRESVRLKAPTATVEGVLAQPMAASAVELLVGAFRDATFGPFVTVGFGGLYAEIFRDVVTEAVPLERSDALGMIRRLRGIDILTGARGELPRDIDAVAEVLVGISRLMAEHPEVSELDLNPVLVRHVGEGVAVVDSLVLGDS